VGRPHGDADHCDWEAARARYFRLNWLRATATWAAFASLIAATVVVGD
jgi:hypothetical protein